MLNKIQNSEFKIQQIGLAKGRKTWKRNRKNQKFSMPQQNSLQRKDSIMQRSTNSTESRSSHRATVFLFWKQVLDLTLSIFVRFWEEINLNQKRLLKIVLIQTEIFAVLYIMKTCWWKMRMRCTAEVLNETLPLFFIKGEKLKRKRTKITQETGNFYG